MNTPVLALLLLVPVALLGCSDKQQPPQSALIVYEKFLHFKPPDSVSEFSGTASNGLFDLMSSAYFQYKAKSSYFHFLQAQHPLSDNSDINSPFVKVACQGYDFIQDFSYWTEKNIKLDSSECYTGVFYPTVHYIVYQTVTKQVDHFVTGVR